jgi:ligand-binding sensor domain-containing protein/DNA-binding CsgD family transcriptional regulator
MIKPQFYCFLVVYCLPFLLLAQSPYYFEPITANNSLPHQTVFRVLQDKKGWLWFGTQRGLVRYDGYAYRLSGQTAAEMESIWGKPIHALFEDKQGNLWIGTHTGDLCKRNVLTGKFEYLSSSPIFQSLRNKRIQTFFEDAQGQIWIGTLDDGLFIYSPKNKQLTQFYTRNSTLTNNAVFAFVEDKKGRIWVGTAGEGINYFDPITKTFRQRYADVPNLNGYQKSLLLDTDNHLWIGTQGTGLYQLSLTTDSMKHFSQSDKRSLSSDAVMSLAVNKNNELLIATDGGGLNVLNLVTKQWNHYKTDNQNKGSLNTNALYDICIDADENVWVGTFNGGVNAHKAHQVRFEYFTYTGNHVNELSNRSVLGLCQTSDEQIFIGTDGGGLNVLDRKNNRFSRLNNTNPVQTNVVKTIFEDRQKRLWLGYFNGGLALFDRQRGTFKHYLSNPMDTTTISNNSVWAIAEDASGLLWVGTVGNGINLFDPQTGKSQRFYNNNDPNSLSNNGIMVILSDRQQRTWVGTEGGGVNLYNPTKGNFTRFQHEANNPQSISSNFIRAIFEDKRGRLWFGTEDGGINLWLGGNKFKHWTTKNGLLSDAVMGISEDLNGYLWLSTYDGIVRFDTDKDSFQHFKFNQTLDGRANQFNQGAIVRTQNGELLFGGINGLNIIQPNAIVPNHLQPRVLLTDFKIFDASVVNGRLGGRTIFEGDLQDTKQMELSYKDNAFSIEFAALDFTEPMRNKYTFKMEGFDADWRFTTAEQRLVTYTNLDAGTYTFRVRATNSTGEWSSKEAVVRIRIAPPFWKTAWFQLLVFAILVSLGVIAFQIYVQRRETLLRQRVLESEQEILSLKNQQLEAEQSILTLRNDKLATEVDTKNNELMSKAAQMAHKNELLLGIKDNLENIKTADDTERTKSLRSLTRTLESEIASKEGWEQFLLYFNQVNQTFMHDLQLKHPNLTQNDLRMCALTRLNMPNREMATLLNISIKGIEKSRYRLKKRLDLDLDADLSRYLMTF